MKAVLHRILKPAALAAALTGLVLTGTASAQGIEHNSKPTAGSMVADLGIARPFFIATTAAGVAVFVASLPFSLAGGNVEEAGKALVVEPAKNAFVRCLGCRNAGYVGNTDQ